MSRWSRRRFLKQTGITAAGLAPLAQVKGMSGGTRSREKKLNGVRMAQIAKDLAAQPREEIFSALVAQIRLGATPHEVMGAVLLAGVQHINPRPVGFKLHAVMMTGSALDLAAQTPPASQWLPVFWNADDFKQSQQRDVRAGDWEMPPQPRAADLELAQAKVLLGEAFEQWDSHKADRAVCALVPQMVMADFFELIWHPAARCFANLGHKIIYASQLYRALSYTGWQACGLPVMRSLVHGLLDEKPGQALAVFEENRRRLAQFPKNWQQGKPDVAVSKALWQALKTASPSEAAALVVTLLQQGVAYGSIWDGIRLAASDMLYRDPTLLVVHPLTATNGMHIAFRTTRQEDTKKLLLLQAASWIVLYRRGLGNMRGLSMNGAGLAQLLRQKTGQPPQWKEVAATLAKNRRDAQHLAIAALQNRPAWSEAAAFLCRRLYQAAREHHQYKYTAAVLQEADAADPVWAGHILSAGFAYLPLGEERDTDVYIRAKKALSQL